MTEEVRKIYEQYRNRQTFYDILGVKEDASFQNISNARDREVRLSWNRPNDVARINEAYRVLSNPITRREYDELLKAAVHEVEEPEVVAAPAAPIVGEPEVVAAPAAPIVEEPEVVATPAAPIVEEPEVVAAPTAPIVEEPEVVAAPAAPIVEEPEVVAAPTAPKADSQELAEAVENAKKVLSKTPLLIDMLKSRYDKATESKLKDQINVLNEAIESKNLEGIKQETANLEGLIKSIESQMKEENALIDEETKRKNNRKKILKGAAIVAGTLVFFGPIGALISIHLLRKSKKFKLQKVAKQGILKSVRTEESNLIEAKNAELEKEIEKILMSPENAYNNHKLEIARAKYQNNIDILEARIAHKQKEIDELGMKAHNRLHLFALKATLKTSIKRLELLKAIAEKKKNLLDRYNPTNSNDKLAEINEEIENLREEIENDNIKSGANRKNIKLKKLNSEKLAVINKMKLKKNKISRWQVIKAIFGNKTPKEENIVEEPIEAEENIRVR